MKHFINHSIMLVSFILKTQHFVIFKDIDALKSTVSFSIKELVKQNENDSYICGISSGSSPMEVFLADLGKSLILSINMNTGHQRIVFSFSNCAVVNVAYSEQTKTLIVVTFVLNEQGADFFILNALKSDDSTNSNSDWRLYSHDLILGNNCERCTLRPLSDGSFVFGEWYSDKLYIVRTTNDHFIKVTSTIELPCCQFGFDVKIDENGYLLIVAAPWTDDQPENIVALYREKKTPSQQELSLIRVEEQSQIQCTLSWQPIFYEDTVIVFRQTVSGMAEIAQLHYYEGRLEEFRIIRRVPFYWFCAICNINNKLLGFENNLLTIYKIVEQNMH